MTLHFKVITNSNASAFEKDVNDFMEKNDIMDIKYSVSGSSFTAFVMYCNKEEKEKEIQEKIESAKNDLNKRIDMIKQANYMRA